MLDQDQNFISLNKAYANILGYYVEEMEGLSWYSTFHPDEQLIAADEYNKMRESGKATFEVRGYRKTKEIVYLEVTLVANIDKSGIFKGYHCFLRDITERKESEGKIRRNQELLSEVQRITNLGSWEWDIRSNLITWSDELFRIYGYEPGQIELNFDSFLKAIHPEDREMVNQTVQASYRTLEPFSFEHKILRPDGTIRILLGKGRVICSKTGDPEKMVGSALDISEIKEAEIRLKRSESLLLEAQELARLGNWEMDLLTQEMVWSDMLFRIYGLKQREKKIKWPDFLQLLPESSQEILKNSIAQIMKSHKPAYYEHTITMFDGDERTISGLAKPIINSNGDVVRVSGYAQDISERKLVEETLKHAFEELNNAQDQLKKANFDLEERVRQRTEEFQKINLELNQRNLELVKINNDLDNFVYTASHDLKAPISNLEGLVMALNDELPTPQEEVKVLMDLIGVCIGKFKETIRDLTEITKIQKEQLEDVSLVSFSKVLEEVKMTIQEMIISSEADIQEDFSVHPEISFSKRNLRSMLYNLLSNAIKYKDPERKPIIRMWVQNHDGIVSLHVKDNGLGIDMNHKDKIFTMFKRLHDHVEGSGVGLYIVKRMVENSGGKIEVESKVGQGTEFKIFFRG